MLLKTAKCFKVIKLPYCCQIQDLYLALINYPQRLPCNRKTHIGSVFLVLREAPLRCSRCAITSLSDINVFSVGCAVLATTSLHEELERAILSLKL